MSERLCYTLQWSETGEGDPEADYFPTLQLALIRIQQLANEADIENFVASIFYDNQDDDGRLYDVCYFTVDTGFIFSTDPIPAPSGNLIPYFLRKQNWGK
jgi:hypothetical protein